MIINFDDIEENEIFDLIDGFYAYDVDSHSSGIKDDYKKQQLIEWLKNQLDKPENKYRIVPTIIDRFVAKYFFSENALVEGYGLEDCNDFIEWLESNNIAQF